VSRGRRLALLPFLLLALVSVPLAVSGFWADRALSDSDGYAARMQDAWLTGGFQGEINELVTTAATERVQDFFGANGTGQNFLADLALQVVTDRIDAGLASGDFVKAWTEWHRQLHQDLAATVQGGQPETTAVAGSTLTTDLTPLVSALLSGGIGDVARNALGDEVLVQQIDLGYDLQGQLRSLGDLWSARWWAAAAALVAVAAASWIAVPHLRGTAWALFAGSAGCLAAWVWRLLPAPSVDIPTTALSRAVTDALVGTWSTWLLIAGLTLAAGGTAVLLRQRRASFPTAPAAARA